MTRARELTLSPEAIGVNYMNFSFFFGTMELADGMRSIKPFARDVMPKLGTL